MSLELRPRAVKRNATFYLDEETIAFIAKESKRIGASRNATLTAIIDDHRKRQRRK